MYVGSYSPIQNAFSSTGAQPWQSGQAGFPIQHGFAGPIQAQPTAFQTGIHPWQMGSFSAIPYNVVSYSFNPAWQSSSFMPSWGWNQSNAFATSPQVMGGFPPIASSYRLESSSGIVQPRVELAETNTDLVITAELPNVNSNDINLTITDDSLTISAFAFSGSGMIPVHRTICLPTSIRSEHVNASFTNGIMEARLPKSDANVRRRIKVSPSI